MRSCRTTFPSSPTTLAPSFSAGSMGVISVGVTSRRRTGRIVIHQVLCGVLVPIVFSGTLGTGPRAQPEILGSLILVSTGTAELGTREPLIHHNIKLSYFLSFNLQHGPEKPKGPTVDSRTKLLALPSLGHRGEVDILYHDDIVPFHDLLNNLPVEIHAQVPDPLVDPCYTNLLFLVSTRSKLLSTKSTLLSGQLTFQPSIRVQALGSHACVSHEKIVEREIQPNNLRMIHDHLRKIGLLSENGNVILPRWILGNCNTFDSSFYSSVEDCFQEINFRKSQFSIFNSNRILDVVCCVRFSGGTFFS